MIFFFNDTATTEIYTLSLHDALPIYEGCYLLGTSLARPLIAKRLVEHARAEGATAICQIGRAHV